MRLPLIPPAQLDAAQTPLHADMRAGIEGHFKGFATIAPDGALMGPWNPWIHWPKIGGPIWELTKALSFETALPRAVREVAILVTGAKFRAAYEIYAHVIAAEQRGLPDAKIATIVAGEITYRDGDPTGALPGRLLRGGQTAPMALAAE
jgi:hypothetical protein